VNLKGFQACDFRGIFGNTPDSQVSPIHAFIIGECIADLVPKGEMALVSGDGRVSTPTILGALMRAIGNKAHYIGTRIPTPVAYYYKHAKKIHSSVIVTASHNPAEFNGIKIQIGDRPITPEQMATIRNWVSQRYANGLVPHLLFHPEPPPVKDASANSIYARFLVSLFKGKRRRASVALDCMHGCWSGLAASIVADAGYEVNALRDKVLPDFGGAIPDPSEDSALKEISQSVARGNFLLGVGLDGDGDRVRFLDEHGKLLDNGTMMVLFVRYLIETGRCQPGARVVYDQKTRIAVVRALVDAGAKPIMERSGHTFIRKRILDEKTVFGGENSGHFFWNISHFSPFPAGDCGLFATLAAADMIQFYGMPLSELATTVACSPFYTGDIRNLRYAGNRQLLFCKIADALREKGYKPDTTDGIRIEQPDAFAHLRPSVTEPDMITAVFDADSSVALKNIAHIVCSSIPQDAKHIALTIKQKIEELLCSK